jgi:hypothetical protein
MSKYNFRERKNVVDLYTRTKILKFPTPFSIATRKPKYLPKHVSFKNMLQDMIVSKLKLSRKTSIVKGRISIAKVTGEFLTSEYDIRYQFKQGESLLRDLAIDTTIFREERPNSPISVENFEIRLVRMRANNYIVKDNNLRLKKKQTSKNPIVEFKFSRVTTPEANAQINDEVETFNNNIFVSP